MTDSLSPGPARLEEDLEVGTIPARYAREALARLAVEPAAGILSAAGIDPQRLRRRNCRLTPQQFERVYAGAVKAGQDEAFGYTARPIPPGTFAFLLRSLSRCADIETCFAQAIELYRLFDPGGSWTLTVVAGTAHLRLSTPTRAQAHSILFTHGMLLAPWRVCAWLCGQATRLLGVTMPGHFRSFASETRYLFGCAPEFGAVAEMRFPAPQLKLPVVRAPGDVPSYLRQSLRALLLGAPGDPLEDRVRRLLAASQPFASASVNDVARQMAMSRQTLARRLQRSGTSFADLRDRLRRDYAISLLSRGVRLADAAETLGYSEPSAFQRAFKVWTGAPPGRYLASNRQ